MQPSRRNFLRISETATGFTFFGFPVLAQSRRQTLSPPAPADSLPHMVPGRPVDRRMKRLELEQRKEDFCASYHQLANRVAELGRGVNELDSLNFFSVGLCKETEAIEHLAKRLKSLAKS